MVVTCLGPSMAIFDDPYVSEFEFAARFHPSRNRNCSDGRSDEPEDDFRETRFATLRSRRSPEEGSPVGQEPSIEVRAILVRCPRNEEEADDVLINRNVYNITAGRSQDILDFHGFDRDEPARHSEVRDCRRKLIVTMKFNNIGRTKTQDEFVVIDHVLDPVTMHKSRLLNPFVIKVRQEPVLQLYGLKFQGVVNAEAREEVISKKMSNYTGCDDDSENPTCGQMIFDGKPIPYSQGFCCSCDPELNVQRETAVSNDSAMRPFPSFFTKIKDRPMRPFKSPRSVNEHFLDDLSDADETSDKESARNEERLGNPDSVNVDRDLDLFKNDNSNHKRNIQDDERDLINLKISNNARNRRPVQPHKKISADTGEFLGYVNKSTANNRIFDSRPGSLFHHRERVNLSATLKKLEEDYKNLRLSSFMRSADRSNNNITAKQKLHPGGKYSSQLVNDDRFDNDRQERVSTSTNPVNLLLPVEGNSQVQLPTLSIDVLFAIRPKQNLTSPDDSTSLTTCPMVSAITESVLESATVLRQKLISDRVYPSVRQSNVLKIDEDREIDRSSSANVTTDASHNVGTTDVQENVAEPNDLEVFNNTQSDVDPSEVNVMHNATSSENGRTTSWRIQTKSTSSGSTENPRDPTQSFDNLSGRAESPANSSSSFSSGSHSKGDAITPSGSLKNQLADWFSHARGRKFRRRKGRKKQGEDEVGEIGYNGEVRSAGVTPTFDNPGRHYEDQTTTAINVRGPVRVYLEPDGRYEPSNGGDDGKSIHETSKADENDSTNVTPDYLESERNVVTLSSKYKPRRDPRSYRSVADDESFTDRNDDRQRSIDKKIEAEFIDISEALKDAADTSKVIRERPSSGSTFENDASVMEKFRRMKNVEREKYEPLQGVSTVRQLSTYTNHLKRDDETSGNTADFRDHENQTPLIPVKHTEEFGEPASELPLTTGHQIVVDRFKLVENFQTLHESYEQTSHPTLVGPKTRQLNTSKSNTEPPIPMIENLKKELQAEAQHFSSSPSPLQSAATTFKDVQGYSNVDEVRETNTELTPAEKVEDLVTDEGTLPPDEETKMSTTPPGRTTMLRNFNDSATEETKISDKEPEVAFKVLASRYASEQISPPSKRTNKMMILFEKPSQSVEPSLHRRGRRRNHKKRHHHRHHHRRVGRHRRRSIEPILNGTRGIASPENTTQRHLGGDEPANKAKPRPSTGKLYVSLSRIPESDHDSMLAGLRIKEVPKIEAQIESQATVNEFGTSTMISSSEPEAPGQVDEMPIFEATKSSSNSGESKNRKSLLVVENDSASARKMRNAGEIQKRNYETLSTIKFRSLYPKSSEVDSMPDEIVDEATASEDVGRNNKRDDLTQPDDSDNEALVFYDYDTIDEPSAPVTENEVDENKRSLRNLGPDIKDLETELEARSEGTSFTDRKDRRSMNMSRDQYPIEPSSGWKQKMELLKLKKHADVLKEYLNWRHDIVPPEPQEISGYTTKISMTNEQDGTVETVTNVNFNVSIEATLSSITQSQETSTTTISTSSKHDVSEQPETTDSFTTLRTPTTVKHFGNCSFNESDTTSRMETTTGYLNHDTTVNEDSTGRILPPCCHTTKDEITTYPTGFHEDVDRFSSRLHPLRQHPPPKTSSEGIPGRRGQLNDVENDLVIISIMEKNRRKHGNIGNLGGGPSVKIERIQEDDGPDLSSRRRRYKSQKKIRRSGNKESKKTARGSGRRLMSFDDSEYKADNEEDDLTFGDIEDNLDTVQSTADIDASSLNDDQDSAKLKDKWNQLIDKIVHNSSEVWNPANSTESFLNVTGDYRSAMKELHFINAEKYIKQMARKIAHNANFHDEKHDEIGAVNVKNRPKKFVRLGRKLKSHRRLGSKVVRKVSSMDNEGPSNPSALQSNPNADSNASDDQESSDQDQLGRDFAISLSGKIHVEGGTNGQPMSISFDTSPEIANRNETLQGGSLKNADPDNSTNTESVPNSDFLSSIFNIAPAPNNLTHQSQEANDNLNSSASGPKSSRNVVATDLQPSRENNHRRSPQLVKKSAVVRRSRAVDEGIIGRFGKYREDRSFDREDSSDLKDVPEDSESEYYPDSPLAYDDDSEHEQTDDSKVSAPSSSDLEEGLDQDRNPDTSDVKVLKIIPVTLSKSSSGFRHQNWQDEREGDPKPIRMTASQLPKMEDDLVPGVTVKPGKIKPAMLPWQENSEDKMLVPDEQTFRQDLKASGSCSPTLESGNPEKNVLYAPCDRFSTSKPVSLKVIGLVSMEQPPISGKKNPNSVLDSNYEIVPLIHVKIQQQPDGRGNLDRTHMHPAHPDNRVVNVPPGHPEGCPKIEMTKSRHHFRGDSCPDINEADNMEDDSDQPEVATMNMDNDEELREPSGIGSCPDSNSANCVGPCGDQRNTTTSHKPSCGRQNDRNDARQRIKLKNMLAIMEFINKIRGMMSGDETEEVGNTDAVINLGSVVSVPANGTMDTLGKPSGVDRFVVMGEGVKHERPQFKEFNTTSWNPEKLNATWSGASKKDQDKSFLFSGSSDKVEDVKQATYQDPKYRDLSPMDSGEVGTTDHPRETFEDRQLSARHNEDPHGNNEPFTIHSESESTETIATNATNTPDVYPNVPANGDEAAQAINSQQGNETQERDVLENLQRKINDRLRGMKRDNLARNDVKLSTLKKERSVATDNFPSVTKIKRHRLRSFLRDPRRQVYQTRSSPTDGEVFRLGRQKFRRLAKGDPEGKRRRKKKKKPKKRRRKKKKKKKKHKTKKGKNLRDTEVKDKTWWPFGRQLMSLSEQRDPNFNLYADEIRENRNRGVLTDLRERRRVHRAKFPHGKRKKTKKRRKHKKTKSRKKKKKMKSKKVRTTGARSKRQIRPSGTQARGGQDCLDRRHPPNVNPEKYLESAHCLRFSDLWYSVYELEDPIMEHTVYLQVFEKHNRADGTTRWEDLTQGSMIAMGTFTRHQRDSVPTIVFTYSGAKIEPQNRALNLDPSTERLLIPSPVPPKKAADYPEVRDGAGEYLVVKASAISKDGNDCDKAGVGFMAFSKQPDRCGRSKGSCLKNQPLAYWRHDMEARESGGRGCYFLSNFGSVPSKPIKYNVSGTGSREYLGLEYHSAHVSAIDIQVRSDYNAIVRVGSSGRVTEVHVDSTAPEHTVVTVVISNMGLASSPYQPRITDCPAGLPVSWTRARGIMQVIPPQRDQRVTLDLYGRLLINGFHCSVEVVNHRGELVAMRRIRVQRADRCLCVWHCLCACIGSVSGMGCQPMSPEHYHAAGFRGPVPVVTAETSVLANAVKNVLMLSALLVLLLLVLGMLKWFVGIFAPAVGRWGLDGLLEGSRIDEYLEPELRCRCVRTDDDGWPVHPDTGQRTVRLCSRKLEFVLNLIFFLTYPVAVCCAYFKRSLNSSRQRRCCPDESKTCLINDKGSCPKMICVSTYGDGRNTKLEAEDTRYVMSELKKSRESLANPRRTKKKDGDKNDPKSMSKKSSHKNRSVLDVNAKKFVDDLLKHRMVFRNLTEPIGGLAVTPGTPYSLRGYFLNAENGGYRFITPCPFNQHWLILNDQKTASKPPTTYPSNLFMRSFGTARDVYESNELSLSPKGVCVNVQYQEDA